VDFAPRWSCTQAPPTVPQTDIELAKALARRYSERVLISPETDSNPYAWELVTPDGHMERVHEIPREDEQDDDGVVIDEQRISRR